MSFKTIFNIVGVDESAKDLLVAAELCERTGAHLSAAVVACVPPAPFGDITGAAYSAWSAAWEAESKRIKDRTAELRSLLAGKRLAGEVNSVYCLRSSIDEEVAERARYADLSLIGEGLMQDDFLFRRVLEGVLFQSPAPVVLAPSAKPVNLTPKTVLVAWNSSLEASVAVRHAMDMLTGAADVRIVLVDPLAESNEMGQEPGADVATFLARHGVKATVDVIASGGREVDEALRQHAADINADLIVMGGYGHSRMRELIFGGVTRSMIEKPEIPVLLAH